MKLLSEMLLAQSRGWINKSVWSMLRKKKKHFFGQTSDAVTGVCGPKYRWGGAFLQRRVQVQCGQALQGENQVKRPFRQGMNCRPWVARFVLPVWWAWCSILAEKFCASQRSFATIRLHPYLLRPAWLQKMSKASIIVDEDPGWTGTAFHRKSSQLLLSKCRGNLLKSGISKGWI